MTEKMVTALIGSADETDDLIIKNSLLLEAALRPGLTQFLREHVLVHGGIKTMELPSIFMATFARLSNEMVTNTLLKASEDTKARLEEAFYEMILYDFERYLEHYRQTKKTAVESMRRPDA